MASRKARSRSRDGVCHEFASLSRRDVLRAGGLSLLGFPWHTRSSSAVANAGVVAATRGAANAAVPVGRAKACIFLFMWGGPRQLDTWEPKPEAPSEVRGPFAAIETSVPGVRISEHFKSMATRMDKVAIIRSLAHTDPAHLSSGHATLTGHLAPVINSDAEPPSERDTPHMGSVVSRARPADARMPAFVTMPWLAYHPAAPGGQAPGQGGGWLGHKNDPFILTGDPSQADWRVPELSLADDISLGRLENRRALLASIDQRRLLFDRQVADADAFQERAFGLLGSAAAREAFDLSQEPASVREKYGMNIHGQCVLLARRLVERGVSLVNVNWHNDGKNFWDTHNHNFERLKNDLIPPADQALAALLDDLVERGLLDQTVVAWVGEFGRTPRIVNTAGREHYPRCYSGLLAGGGIRGGSVYGESDRHASEPIENLVSPADYAATIYHALGIPPDATLIDRFGRPLRYCQGEPIASLFG